MRSRLIATVGSLFWVTLLAWTFVGNTPALTAPSLARTHGPRGPTGFAWAVQRVESPRQFEYMGNRGMALDEAVRERRRMFGRRSSFGCQRA